MREVITLIIIIIVLLGIIFYLHIKHNKFRQQFIQILNTMHQAIMFFDEDGKLTFYNNDAKKILSLSKTDLTKDVDQIFHNKKIKEAFIKKELSSNFDITYKNKIYAANIFYSNSEKANEYATIVLLEDVTKGRNIEQTKRDFFSHASHELKSPLTAIIGYSELISLKMIDENEYEELNARIYKQAMHMSLLVEEMSTLSKLEAIPSNEVREELNLLDVLNETIESLESFITDKKILFDLKTKSILFKAVKLDINKLFKNLIENAIKYSHKNSTIIIILDKNDKDEIIFSIKDHGIGISPVHQKRVFERFYRVDKGRIDLGTGIGLAIVKHIVIKYKGLINLKSEINEGTLIEVNLPIN